MRLLMRVVVVCVCLGLSLKAAAADAVLTVLPLLGSGEANSLAPNLTGMLFAELRRFEGLELRIRQPNPPLTGRCLTSPECLTAVAARLQAELLLVGVVLERTGQTRVTLLLFDARGARPVRSASFELAEDPAGHSTLLRPQLEPLALAAGGRLPDPTPPASFSSASSIGALIERSPTQPIDPSAPRPQVEEPTPAALDWGQDPEARAREVARREEEERLRALKAAGRVESRDRDHQRREARHEREQQLKLAERTAEVERRRQLWEGKQRAFEEERRRKLSEKRRDENMARKAQGLPPIPEYPADQPLPPPKSAREVLYAWVLKASEPPTRQAEGGSASLQARPSSGDSSEKKTAPADGSPRIGSSSPLVASVPGPVPGAETTSAPPIPPADAPGASQIVGLKTDAPARLSVLENEGPWILGGGGSVAGLVGLAVVGPQLEVALEPVRRIWLEAGGQSLHGVVPERTTGQDEETGPGDWFYLYTGRLGATARLGEKRLHPFIGGDAVLLLFGPKALALGGSARAGLDLLLTDALGLRLELSVGAVVSDTFQSEPFGYPEPIQLCTRGGLSLRYRLE